MTKRDTLITKDKLERLLKLETKLRENFPSRFKPIKEDHNDASQ